MSSGDYYDHCYGQDDDGDNDDDDNYENNDDLLCKNHKILFFDWCMGRKVSDQIDPQINIHSPLHIDHKTVHLNKGIK